MISTMFAMAQANNVVVFSQDGYKFTLIINGLRQNEKPETNVKVTGLIASQYKAKVIFEDTKMPALDQNLFLSDGGNEVHGKEFTYSIQANKKGEMKLRPQSMADIPNTTAPDQVVYVFNPTGNATQAGGTTTTISTTTTTTGTGMSAGNPSGTVSTTVNDGTGGTTSTTTTTTSTGNGAAVNMNVGGLGVNINVTDNMGGMATTSTTTTTTSTTSSSSTSSTGGTMDNSASTNNSNTCYFPMSSSEFATAKNSVEAQSFSEEKMKVAKQILNSNCMSTAQVKDIMSEFSMDDEKVEWAEFAYGKTTDPNNFYQLNDGFSFSTSVDKLNSYIESHKK